VIVNFVAPLDGIAAAAVSYNVSRWALAGLTLSAAVELAPHGVRLCGVAVPPLSGGDPRIAAAAVAVAQVITHGTPGLIVRLEGDR